MWPTDHVWTVVQTDQEEFWWDRCGRTLYSLWSCILYCDRWVLSWGHLSSLLYSVRQSQTGMSSTVYFQTTGKQSNFVVTHTSHPWSTSFRCLCIFIVFPHEIQTIWFCGCPLFTCLFILFVCMYICIHIYIYIIVYKYTHTYMYIYKYIYIGIYIYAYIYVYICTCPKNVYIHVYNTYICIYIFIYTYVYM